MPWHGGCPCSGSGSSRYGDPCAFAGDYSAVLPSGLYSGVLGSAGTTLRAQLAALGRSPWAGSHYDDGGGPGSSLMRLYGLLQPLSGIGLDDPLMATQPPPPPPSPPPPVVPPVAAGTDLAALLLLAAGLGTIGWIEHRRPGTLAGLPRVLAADLHRVVGA